MNVNSQHVMHAVPWVIDMSNVRQLSRRNSNDKEISSTELLRILQQTEQELGHIFVLMRLAKDFIENNMFTHIIDEEETCVSKLESHEEIYNKIQNEIVLRYENYKQNSEVASYFCKLEATIVDITNMSQDIRWLILINDGSLKPSSNRYFSNATELFADI